MTWFTGTSTGDRYTVGQVYSNASGSYRANPDGSFTNVKTGRTDVGSSQDPRTVWGGSSIVSGGRDGGAGPGSAAVVAGGRSAVTSGPGSGITVSGGAGDPGSGPGAFVFGDITLEPKMKKTHTQLVIGGGSVAHDPGWSDAGEVEERWGEGELLSPTWFYQWGVVGADAWKSVERFREGNVKRWKKDAQEIDEDFEEFRRNGVFAPDPDFSVFER